MYGSFGAYAIVTSIITTVLYLGYFAIMESTQGKTVGKMVMKLHVEGPGGGEAHARGGGQAQHLAGLPDPRRHPVPRRRRCHRCPGRGDHDRRRRSTATRERKPWTDKFAGTQVIKEG